MEIAEGVTWEGLLKGLKETFKAEAEVQEGTVKVNDSLTWRQLLGLLYEERSFFGLKKDPGGRAVFFKEKSSQKVLDCFFEKAWEAPILGSG